MDIFFQIIFLYFRSLQHKQQQQFPLVMFSRGYKKKKENKTFLSVCFSYEGPNMTALLHLVKMRPMRNVYITTSRGYFAVLVPGYAFKK